MCSPATCSTCGKVTWAGCGQHIDQVFANVPQDRRCPGHDSGTGSNASFINKLLSFR
ncbi:MULTISPECIES: hypothetical protein [Sinomonas]|jgi:hypothetical protein|uniref:Uncharacterized protein n=1 Tax=Sinomonas flava TaxID=496857 RepID=A0ABN3C288_9MICC|nr:hypothetical protein [Sinomonas sp. R1AF57]ASN53513.1 hypothetical protein CGQ25_16640 [Sinomonas sp. R1AF57]